MKIKNRELRGFDYALAELAKIKMNGKLAYNVAKTLTKVSEALEIVEKSRKDIFTTHSEKEENGIAKLNEKREFIFISDEEKAEAVKKFEEVLDLEIDLEVSHLTIKDIESIEEITPQIMFLLGDYITE
jgi:hypothetical protein